MQRAYSAITFDGDPVQVYEPKPTEPVTPFEQTDADIG